MKQQIELHPCDVQEKIKLPSERLVRCLPAIAPIAALHAAIATTRIAILCDNPSINELVDMIEYGDDVPPHLFIAHNIIQNLDQLRLTIDCYFQHVNTWSAQFNSEDLPF